MKIRNPFGTSGRWKDDVSLKKNLFDHSPFHFQV